MTKFILAGGHTKGAADGGKAFCEELVDGFDQPARILDCVFAQPRDGWRQTLEEDRFFFAKNLREKVRVELAEPETFVEQMKKMDAVYFRGGDERLLIDMMAGIPGWRESLAGKTVAGGSAGAILFCKYYFDLDAGSGIKEATGILPIKLLVHYQSDYNAPNIDWDAALAELTAYGEPDMEVLAIREGEFVVR